jgi:hypothetical protein
MVSHEAVIIQDVQADIIGLRDNPVTVQCEPDDTGCTYTIGFGDTLLTPGEFYTAFHDTAPNTGDDNPDGVVDDWVEPDRDTTDAKERIDRHEQLLGEDWADFMVSRPTFIEILEGIPRIRGDENEVRAISGHTERAAFAAAYIISGRDQPMVAAMLESTGLGRSTIDDLQKVVNGYMPKRLRPYTDASITLGAENGLQRRLLQLPANVTDKIIRSTLPHEYRPIGDNGRESYKVLPRFGRLLRHVPGSSFSNKYCVQAVRQPDGTIMAIPYAHGQNSNYRSAWYIPSWSSFASRERQGAVCQAAIAKDPADSFEIPAYAITAGSLRAADSALKVQPQIRWHSTHDGRRTFDISISMYRTGQTRVVDSGVFGVILAAAMQPDLRVRWPQKIMEKDMGVAQLPVLALKRRRQLAGGFLLRTAEMAAGQY